MTTYKEYYERALTKLLEDPSVCVENRDVFKKFFEWEEYKLQRENDLRQLDEPCYKTLYLYTTRLRIVNRWFGNRPWCALSRDDIQAVYDDVEDGKILTVSGKPFKGADTYYGRILKGKPFELAGVSDFAKNVIHFQKHQRRTVRFATQDGFLKLVSVFALPRHLLLFWLAWDIGENIGTLLQLQKKDFKRALNPDNGEPEYLVNLASEKLKRTRQVRREPTLYPETVRYCDMVLEDLDDEDEVFKFGHRQAFKLICQAGMKTGVKCEPNGERLTWKDLRSGMACHLLSNGWLPHEVNLRLGHTPNAKRLNLYINHLAIDRHRPKRRLYESKMEALQEELRELKERERLSRGRIQTSAEGARVVDKENHTLKSELAQTKERVEELAQMVTDVLARLPVA